MKNPIRVLLHEHEVIVSATSLAKKADLLLAANGDSYEKVVRKLIAFFRVYADQYHHFKEEEILFPEMGKKNELLAEGVIKEMLENHEDFRNMIRSIESFLDRKEYFKAQKQLHIYTEALLDHIAVENDEVFQMAESLMSAAELESMYFRFSDCDAAIGDENRKSGVADKSVLADQLDDIRNAIFREEKAL